MNRSKTMRRWGWTAFKLMWIPFTMLFIGMIGMPEGEYAWVELPTLTRYSMIGVAVLAATAVVLLLGASLLSGQMNRHIQERGRRAEAEILQLWDTGTTVNKNPLVRMQLEVRPDDRPPFQAETERLISRLDIPKFQEGTVIPVKYDPESKEVAVLDDEQEMPLHKEGESED